MKHITLEINEAREIVLPQAVTEQILSGASVLMERRRNGTVGVRIDEPETKKSEGLRLVEQDGLLVIAGGKLPDDFDWDEFMREEREAPLHPFEPDRDENPI